MKPFPTTANNRVVVHTEKLFGNFLLHFHNLSAQTAHLGVPHSALVVGEKSVGNIGQEKEEQGDLLQDRPEESSGLAGVARKP